MEQNWQKKTANMIAVSFAMKRYKLFRELTDNVLHFKTQMYNPIKNFKWVTDSIKTSSISVENNANRF
jgi:uncharacterized protein YegL